MTLDLAALDRIEALRQQATSGQWEVSHTRLSACEDCDLEDAIDDKGYVPNVSVVVRDGPTMTRLIADLGYHGGAGTGNSANAAYLAALSPEVVGELVKWARIGLAALYSAAIGGQVTAHVWQTHQNSDAHCREDDHPGTCPTCNLSICIVCGGFEGSLLPACPGARMTPEQQDQAYQDYCNKTGPWEAQR